MILYFESFTGTHRAILVRTIWPLVLLEIQHKDEQHRPLSSHLNIATRCGLGLSPDIARWLARQFALHRADGLKTNRVAVCVVHFKGPVEDPALVRDWARSAVCLVCLGWVRSHPVSDVPEDGVYSGDVQRNVRNQAVTWTGDDGASPRTRIARPLQHGAIWAVQQHRDTSVDSSYFWMV